jgi:hypothetical protein
MNTNAKDVVKTAISFFQEFNDAKDLRLEAVVYQHDKKIWKHDKKIWWVILSFGSPDEQTRSYRKFLIGEKHGTLEVESMVEPLPEEID